MTTEYLTTPIGRVVQGSVAIGNTTGYENKPLKNTDGSDRTEWYLGLAILKTDPGWPELYKKLQAEAHRSFPQYVGANGVPNGPFSWKITDGDSQNLDSRGKKVCDKEGFSGHWILNLSNGWPPQTYGPNNDPIDPTSIKNGFYVRVQVAYKGNGQTGDRMGLFLNLGMVKLIEEGPIIINGPRPEDVFGDSPGTGTGAPVQPPTPPGVSQPPPSPAFVAGAPANPPAPAPVRMLPKANGLTYAAYKAEGWTDAQLVANGYMLQGDDVPA